MSRSVCSSSFGAVVGDLAKEDLAGGPIHGNPFPFLDNNAICVHQPFFKVNLDLEPHQPHKAHQIGGQQLPRGRWRRLRLLGCPLQPACRAHHLAW